MGNDSPHSPEQDSSPHNTEQKGFGHFWAELRRRKVVRVAITYAIVAWLIIQVANATFHDFGIPVWAYRFVIIMLALFFPVAIILAWAFELTPDGIKTTKHAREERGSVPVSADQQRKRNWYSVLFAAAIPSLLFGTLAVIFYLQRSPDTSRDLDKSIAVLPFTNMSANDEHAFFADGVHETILTDLANLRDMRVVSRTSVMAYRNSDKSIKVIGEELGVSYILEGSMQRAENKFRLTAQLIDARTDEHIWAKNFDGELTDIFSVQSQLSKDVANGLHAVLSPQEEERLSRSKSSSIEAYDLYLKALEIRNLESFVDTPVIDLCNQAVELDPTFTDAWLLLADQYGRAYRAGRNSTPEAEQIIKRAIDVAVRLEPDNPNVKVGLGNYFFNCHSDYARARFHIEPVVDVLPNHIEALLSLGTISRSEFRFSDAVSYFQKVHQLDPQSSRPLNMLHAIYADHRQWDALVAVMDEMLAIRPENVFEQYRRARIEYLRRGSLEEVNRLFVSLEGKDYNKSFLYAWLYHSGNLQAFNDQGHVANWKENGTYRGMGGATWCGAMHLVVLSLLDENEFFREVIDFLLNDYDDRWKSRNFQFNLGFVYAVAGDQERARAAIQNAVALRSAGNYPAISQTGAVALGWMGEQDAAVSALETLSQMPADGIQINYYYLKNSLDYYPLRNHPGFQKLLEDPALRQPIPIRNW